MEEYDLRTPDSYTIHLASLTSCGAVATRDIHNDQGVLLVKKGHVIKAGTAHHLLNHKLVQPLETSVSISEAIDANRLFAEITAVVRGDTESKSIHQALNLTQTLRQQCLCYASYPLVAQKLTVLSLRLKAEYDKALFCAWFSLALAVQMRLSAEALADAFLAGLVHDIGLLHIDPAVAEKTGEYTPQEWRAVQSHALIADAFLSYVDGLPPSVRSAVKEHHERCDGSGYPLARQDNKLCLLGQLVAMADTVWAICKKPLDRKGMFLADAITVVKMNKAVHPAEVESALYRIDQHTRLLNGTEAPRSTSVDANDRLMKMRQQLNIRFEVVNRLRGMLPSEHADCVLRSAHVKLERLWFVVTSSGLLSDMVSQWLTRAQNAGEQPTKYDLHELSLMYGELHWQLFQMERALQQVLSQSNELCPNATTAIRSALTSLEPLAGSENEMDVVSATGTGGA